MKIRCEFCDGDAASMYCSVEEAALCASCDQRVHHANMLAGKHHRFSLLLPSPNDNPICDICQKKRAFLFCKQDRAIVCNDCDASIHEVNELTRKHNRFLLTGVKLSAASSPPPSSSSSSSLASPFSEASLTEGSDLVPDRVKPAETGLEKTGSSVFDSSAGISFEKGKGGGRGKNGQWSNGSGQGPTTGSSISKYFTEVLPGWQVEDLLGPPSPYCQVGDTDSMASWEVDMAYGTLTPFLPETTVMWVPQAPSPLNPFLQPQWGSPPSDPTTRAPGDGELLSGTSGSTKASRKCRSDDRNSFAVPQIGPPPAPTPGKRSRLMW